MVRIPPPKQNTAAPACNALPLASVALKPWLVTLRWSTWAAWTAYFSWGAQGESKETGTGGGEWIQPDEVVAGAASARRGPSLRALLHQSSRGRQDGTHAAGGVLLHRLVASPCRTVLAAHQLASLRALLHQSSRGRQAVGAGRMVRTQNSLWCFGALVLCINLTSSLPVHQIPS